MDHHDHTKDLLETEKVEHQVSPIGQTMTTFFILAGLSFLALFVGFSDLGPWKIVASMTVSAIQASVLAVYFMDLKQADKLTWLIAASGIFWVGLLFLFTLTDYLTRQYGVL